MSSLSNSLLIPVEVRGMKCLDRKKFSRIVILPILKIPDEKLSKITQICKSYFLKLSNFMPVQILQEKNSENFNKCIYLNPDKVSKWLDISEADRTLLKQLNIADDNFDKKEVQLNYDNFKHDEIFKAILPENEEVVSGFSQIGHIIHLNLRDHLLEYRSLIGEVLVDKIKTCRTAVNKSSFIDNTYRNFSMEVIAGEEDFLVTVKENRCIFQFDFSKVYWNPRLCKEHERILEFLKPGDILFDVFCGVGPFAVPAAKKKCRVFANDLNPDSFKWLNHNAKQNKVNMSLFKSFNIDGTDFICNTFRNFIIDYCNGTEKLENGSKICVTMNLPGMAVEFLKHFVGLIEDEKLKDKFDGRIVVYVYCFALGDDPYSIAKKMVCDNIGADVTSSITDVFDVRNVAPKKEIMRVTFNLTKEILFSSSKKELSGEPPNKKHCKNIIFDN
ncbi:jg19416 [Pararge aegeria aegeria]|uniref:tRNA (guanine(37)-N1)-methyltransferase n=3 Tax=Pararge aegeria TaxID=116150 RepID=A0A8S4RCE3_9NEOP|nr:jg19416 [Pararge aegeria aegeria]